MALSIIKIAQYFALRPARALTSIEKPLGTTKSSLSASSYLFREREKKLNTWNDEQDNSVDTKDYIREHLATGRAT